MAEETETERVTVVTGGTSGIGARLCKMIAAPGERIVVVGRGNRENADAVVAELESLGAKTLLIMKDLTLPHAGREVMTEALDVCGHVERIVHLAAYADRTRFGELSEEQIDQSFSAQVKAFLGLVTVALPSLKEAGTRGRVVSAGSFLSDVFRLEDEGFPATATTKAAVTAMTKSLANDLASFGVTVNTVSPGYIQKDAGQHTTMSDEYRERSIRRIPMSRFGKPEEVAAVIAFVLSDQASYLTGQVLHVDGGVSL